MKNDLCCEICGKIIYTSYILEDVEKGHIFCLDCFSKIMCRELKYYSDYDGREDSSEIREE